MAIPIISNLFTSTNSVLPFALGTSVGIFLGGTASEKNELAQTALKAIRAASLIGCAAFAAYSPSIAGEILKQYALRPELMLPAAIRTAVSSMVISAAEGAKWGLAIGAVKILGRRLF